MEIHLLFILPNEFISVNKNSKINTFEAISLLKRNLHYKNKQLDFLNSPILY